MVEARASDLQVVEPASQEEKDKRKASTTNSLFISTTISNPNVESIINAVATILHSQMLEDLGQGKTIPEASDLFFFSEEKYIKEKPEAFD
jgi:hypothetical protein